MKFHTVLLLLCVSFLSCSSDENTENQDSPVSDNITQASNPVLFQPFNDIENLREKLSHAGIGKLDYWKSDDAGGYMSITPYYEFGTGINRNDLAYYLTSEDPDRIYELSLVLNINNKNERREAVKKFSEMIRQTYEALGIEENPTIITAAKNTKEVTERHETYVEKIVLEQTRIETWKYIIETN